jgi:hypothetical protein
MPWQYGDFDDAATYPTAALKLARLRLHIGEVRGAISADVSSDGKSRSSGNLVTYLNTLVEERKELEQSPALMNAGGLVKLRRGTRKDCYGGDDCS